MTDPLLNSVLDDRYLLIDILGQGGMGIVYRARDQRLSGRPCAIKLIRSRSHDPTEEQRFERELEIISLLRGNHVVSVLDSGRLPDNRRYIVMELLDGFPLSDLLDKSEELPIARALRITRGILAGLAVAHEEEIIHRDLKPQNIFITATRTGEEITKVLDFGIAKATTSSDQRQELTSASVIIGTPKYMAPEQFLKEPTDVTTDLYAVGLLLYQMLSGAPPFLPDHPSIPDTMKGMPPEFKIGWLHIYAEPKKLPIPEPLWELLSKLLAKKHPDRFASAEEVIASLNFFLQQQQEESAPRELPEPDLFQRGAREDRARLSDELPQRQSSSVLPLVFALLIGLGGVFLFKGYHQRGSGDASAGTPPVAQCTHQISSTPPGAAIYQGEIQFAETPFEFPHPCDQAYTLELKLTGHHRERFTLSKTQRELHFNLRRCDEDCEE